VEFNEPLGLAFDAAGNLYIADSDNNRVRTIAPDGTITTVADDGNQSGSSGDGGLATEAHLILPTGVGFDSNGDLFITESYFNRIREVLATAPYFNALPTSISLGATSGGRQRLEGLSSRQQ
jgi:DNA-binding beta-propeller fold protein YncE